MKMNIGISEANLEKLAQLNNVLLSDEYLLITKTRNAHWNVKGPHFKSLHDLFEEHYDTLFTIIDDAAERVRTLGHVAYGSMAEFIKNSRLQETNGQEMSLNDSIEILMIDHERIIQHLRGDIDKAAELGDVGTEDFFTGIIQQHEKMLWMLRMFIEA